MKVTFLEAEVSLTKTFYLQDGKIEKVGHPRILNYTSHEHEVKDLENFHSLLVDHAAAGHCLLKGNLVRPLVKEPRAGTTNPNETTWFVCLDIDGLKGVDSEQYMLEQLGIGDVDYIVQYSSSMGVLPGKGLSAHVFMLLDKPILPAVLKQYLVQWNLNVPLLRENLRLTATYNALSWALDVTTCQNDKLLYIAPPLLKDGITDSFGDERIKLVTGKKRTLSLPEPFPNAENNREKQEAALNELRSTMGLKARPKTSMKMSGTVEYMAKPDRAVVTGIREKDEFTYLNLNGGDSWGYWHPTSNPEFIYNFKHEPVYKTSELLPDYWKDVKERMNELKPDADGKQYLAFRDFRTATYYNGVYDTKSGRLNMAPAKNAAQLKDFLVQHGQPVGDFVPDWTVMFDPHSTVTVDVESKTINTFQPTTYMRLQPRTVTQVPPVIRKIVLHMLGGDEECFEHFMNWLAVAWQYRTRCLTAWVAHGVQGTGKGLFLDKILRPLFGKQHVITKRVREIDSTFNGYMEDSFFVWVDEAEQSSFKDSMMNADVKNFITEPRISIRKMYTLPYEVDNFLNWIFVSNKGHIITIDPDDRRFNVAVFQPNRLQITDAEIREIDNELVDFACYLSSHKADRQRARMALNNPAKSQMVERNRSAIDTVSDAINNGDLAYFEAQMPQGDIEDLPRFEQEEAKTYMNLVKRIRAENPKALTREELMILVRYTVDDVSPKPTKFTKYMGHHKMEIRPINIGGKTVRGIPVKWRIE